MFSWKPRESARKKEQVAWLNGLVTIRQGVDGIMLIVDTVQGAGQPEIGHLETISESWKAVWATGIVTSQAGPSLWARCTLFGKLCLFFLPLLFPLSARQPHLKLSNMPSLRKAFQVRAA
jgi:hypothetical protein